MNAGLNCEQNGTESDACELMILTDRRRWRGVLRWDEGTLSGCWGRSGHCVDDVIQYRSGGVVLIHSCEVV